MVESDLMTHDRISNQTRKRGPTTAPLSLFLAGNTSPGSQHGVLSEKRIRLKAKRARETPEMPSNPEPRGPELFLIRGLR